MIRFFTYSQFHNKRPVVGSTYLRVNQVMKYWPESGLYKYGENPEVLIFQKVYASADYKFPIHFEGIKILDICDPDWLEGVAIKETVDAMDAVTVPSKTMQDFIIQLTDKPVVVIPDRFDMEFVPSPKEHTQKAKTVVWFGYSHNAELLQPACNLLNELKLNLIVISNDNPLLFRNPNSINEELYSFERYDEKNIYTKLQEADFALLPKGFRPQDKYKSNNKTVKAILAGLPVAHDKETVLKFLEPNNRVEYLESNYGKMRQGYDVKKSVDQYKLLIGQIKKIRT